MTKKGWFLILFFIGFYANSQNTSSDFRTKKFIVSKDTIKFDSVPINPQNFKVLAGQKILYPTEYEIFYNEALLIISAEKYQEITIEYFRFPAFITKTYSPFDKKFIVPNNSNTGQLYSLTTNKKTNELKLFDGLKTSGYINRGITSGNNQSTVANSSMDINIEGKLSDKVAIRANIFDTNIPLQENGYSQSITDFDRIFIELYSKDWRVKAGDISLKNESSYFLAFEKQVSGLEVAANINTNTKIAASGAIVRGQFSSYDFVGIEANQGPYKIFGPNNEPNFVIIAGSEKVFVNGSKITKGINEDYLIDYNIGEVRFNTTFPITNDMRIRVEFQFSNRNYTRFISYENAEYKTNNIEISGYFYNENDVKNQSIQVNLTAAQKQILANAGNNTNLMVGESAYPDVFDANRILYKKVQSGTNEYFEYSTNENDNLFTVTFSNVNNNEGDYVLSETFANGNVFVYVGANLGNYQPITQLIAPTKLQVAVLNSSYKPSKKTTILTEVAFSNNDQNLFSTIDNNQNKGIATKLAWKQTLLDKKWKLLSDVNYLFIHKNFNTIQRFQSVEFNRDWNLNNPTGNQQQIGIDLSLQKSEDTFLNYSFQQLQFSDNFKGEKHLITSNLQLKNTSFYTNSSFLSNNSEIQDNTFLRVKAGIEQRLLKSWFGGFLNIESNNGVIKQTQEAILTNHQFKEYEGYIGLGDSSKVFAKVGFNYRDNDSIRTNTFTEINNRKTYYLDAKIIQTERTNLSLFANYRETENAFSENQKALNSKIIYNQRFLKNFITLGTSYETSSGNVAQQDFVYVEVEAGQGFYTWIDYNDNGIQEFDEFEVAEFQDQANFLRVPLPNLQFIATQSAKINQSITLNANQWSNKTGLKKVLSHFYNQFFLSSRNELERARNSFNLNPFNMSKDQQISVNFTIKNSLYFNRGLQNFSATYTYAKAENKQQYSIGSQDTDNNYQQIDFQHKVGKFWLIDLQGKLSENKLETENFNNRNYEIDVIAFQPKISYVLNNDNRFAAFYHMKNKENTLAEFEKLKQQKIGIEYFYTGKSTSQFNANFTTFFNDFSGNPNSPVGYQMLEGLQEGTNYTWTFLWNKKLNSFLNVNLNYKGRKSLNSKTIHTGTINLKAVF
ncbi:hypothetical protein OAB17_03740 [Flavobacteriaceae bacterium]|nr:hypothetical protein [Flavobacteriaceae bacterium]MDB9798575.1 hypothetical protein [Flavobacteriaceae bacterium]